MVFLFLTIEIYKSKFYSYYRNGLDQTNIVYYAYWVIILSWCDVIDKAWYYPIMMHAWLLIQGSSCKLFYLKTGKPGQGHM